MVGRLGTTLALILVSTSVGVLASGALALRDRSAPHDVYVDGDSLAVGTGWYLSSFLRHWALHATAEVSRHAYQGVLAVEARGGSLERVVVLDLGTNDDPSQVDRFRTYVRDVVRAAGPARCVIWSTINRPPYNGISYDSYNRALVAAGRSHRNFHVFDWAGMARAHPEWFGPDGVHPTNTGYRQRAATLARLIKIC